MKIAGAILISLFLLSGCASTKFGRADLAQRAKTEMIGMSKKDLLLCAGVPVRSQQVEDLEFLTYNSGGDSVGYAAGGSGSSTGGGAISLHKRYCEVTFALQNGVISKVSYAGRTGGLITEGEQCAFVLQNCVPSK
jgi:hypothetical protein